MTELPALSISGLNMSAFFPAAVPRFIFARLHRAIASGACGALPLIVLLFLGEGCASAPGHRPLDAPRHGMGSLVVEQVDRGRIRIARGKRALSLDLRLDFAGCKSEMYDPMEKKHWEAELPLELVDETENPPFVYVVLLAQAASNCNIQGMCGASRGESTLIWLKLTRDLALAAKQAILFDSCRDQRSALIEGGEGGGGTELGFSAKDLPWAGDVLQIEGSSDVGQSRTTWRLTYDRRQADAGLKWVQVHTDQGVR